MKLGPYNDLFFTTTLSIPEMMNILEFIPGKNRMKKILSQIIVKLGKIIHFIIGKKRFIKFLINNFKTIRLVSETNGISFYSEVLGIKYPIVWLEKYKFNIFINPNDKIISDKILISNTWEPEILTVLQTYLKPDTHFLDIGANIGFFSLFIASQCPEARIFSFEPDIISNRLFNLSVLLNQYSDRIQVYSNAVSDKKETLYFSDLGAQHNGGARYTSKIESFNNGDKKNKDQGTSKSYGQYEKLKVDAVRLDDFLKKEKIDIIKIDIEGFEPVAIKGMENIIRKHRPIIVTEILIPFIMDLGQSTPEKFISYFTSINFTFAVIDEHGNLFDCGNDSSVINKYLNFDEQMNINVILIPVEKSKNYNI